MKQTFRAVIFDLDGTLLDTIDDITDTTNSVLEKFGFPKYTPDEYKLMVGEGVLKLVRAAIPPEHLDDETINKCIVELVSAELGKVNAQRTKPYKDIPELLDRLLLNKIRIAILSNRPQSSVYFYAEKFLKAWNFEFTLGAGENFPNKPDPAAAIDIAQRMKIPAQDFLFVGDSGVDMQTAVSAGMRPVGVLWGFRSKEELLSAGAKKLVSSPMELLKIDK